MEIFKPLFFNIKKPVMNDHEIIIEKLKEEIDSLFEYCVSRYDTVDILFQKAIEDDIKYKSTIDDILVIFEMLILNLFNLSFLIYEKGSSKSLENAISRINEINNKNIIKYLSEIISILQKWKNEKDKIYKSRDEMGGIIKNILKELYESYELIKENKLQQK